MSGSPTPGQQLTNVLAAAARVVLDHRFPGQAVGVSAFARTNRTALLTAISNSSQLRHVVRTTHPEAEGSHELLAALLGDDAAASAMAAEKLASHPSALVLPNTRAGRHIGTAEVLPARSNTDAPGIGAQATPRNNSLALGRSSNATEADSPSPRTSGMPLAANEPPLSTTVMRR